MFNVAAIWPGGVLTIFVSPHLVSNIEMAKGKNGHLVMSEVWLYKPSESGFIHLLYTVYEPKRTMSLCHAEASVHLYVRKNLYSPFTFTQNLIKLAQIVHKIEVTLILEAVTAMSSCICFIRRSFPTTKRNLPTSWCQIPTQYQAGGHYVLPDR